MDQTENQNQSVTVSQFIESKFNIKVTQLLLSVSVFSLFFSHSYCLSLLHSFNYTFHDTLAFKFFSHNIDKNFIFFVCNGLLVFLAKYSGLISSLSNHNHRDDQTESTRMDPETPLLEKEVALETTVEALQNSSVIEEEEEVLSDEELSKKFDEFIRKMKEELRIEARQQLVMV